MALFKRFISILTALAVTAAAAYAMDIRIYAAEAYVYYAGENPEGAERNYDSGVNFYGISGTPVFTNNGIINAKNVFTLYKFDFQNNGTVNFTSEADAVFPRFSLNEASFINNGTVSIKGADNFGIQEGTSFINNGTLFLEDIRGFNSDAIVNNGIVVVPDGDENFRYFIESNLSGKGSGQVYTESQFENSSVSYTISYDLNRAESNNYIADNNNNPTAYEYSMANPQLVTLADPTLDGYEFLGWTGLNITEPRKNLTFSSSVQQNVTFTAHWKAIEYSITYDLDGGSFYEGQKPNYSYVRGQQAGLLIPYKTGYIFAGWIDTDTDSMVSSGDTIYYLPPETLGNKHFKASFIANSDTKYKVVCYYETLDGGHDKEEHLFVEQTDETVSVSEKTYVKEGFSYDESANNTLSGTVAADNSLELKIYYKRNVYKVTYKSQDGKETLWETERKYGEALGEYGGNLPVKESDNDLYTYNFVGWARYENLDFAYDLSDSPVLSDICLYAAFETVRDENFVIVKWLTDECEGFTAYPSETKIKSGTDYSVTLELANEKYYVGTPQWHLGFAEAHIYWHEAETGIHAVDYTFNKENFEAPVTITVPNVQHDIFIMLKACYHEEHDYSAADDTIIENGGCIEDSIVRHFCYKCGKTYDETVAAGGHRLGKIYEKNDVFHWKTCAICANEIEKNTHTPDEGVITREPTHNSTGMKTYTCTVCEYVTKREVLAVIPHSAEGEWQYSAEKHYKLCSCGEILETADHISDGGEETLAPDYDNEGKIEYHCTVCGCLMGEEIIPALSHNVEEEWQTNTSEHWKNCECGEKHSLGKHISDGGVETKPATYTEKGEMVHSCTVCGYVLKIEDIMPLPHKGITIDCEWTHDDSGHWIDGCGCGEIHEFAEHTSDNGTVTKYPTETENGEKEYCCKVCGYVIQTEEIPALDNEPDKPTEPDQPIIGGPIYSGSAFEIPVIESQTEESLPDETEPVEEKESSTYEETAVTAPKPEITGNTNELTDSDGTINESKEENTLEPPIGNAERPNENNSDKENVNGSNPKTGENGRLWEIMIVGAAAAAGMVIAKKKRI